MKSIEPLAKLWSSKYGGDFVQFELRFDENGGASLLCTPGDKSEIDRLSKIYLNSIYGLGYRRDGNSMKIKKVVFNNPATIVFWNDGTKTVVKCEERDTYDPEKGLAMAIARKALGNKGNYYDIFEKWLPQDEFAYLEPYRRNSADTRDNVWLAYNRLIDALSNSKSTKSDLTKSINDAAEYLYEILL